MAGWRLCVRRRRMSRKGRGGGGGGGGGGGLQSGVSVPPECSVDNRLKGQIYQTAHSRTLMWRCV